MRIRVNAAKCNGYTLCNEIAPEIIKLDEWGFAYVENPEVPEDQVGLVRQAIQACPEGAIVVEDD